MENVTRACPQPHACSPLSSASLNISKLAHFQKTSKAAFLVEKVSWTSSCPQTVWLKVHRMHVLKYIWAQTSSVHFSLNTGAPVNPQLCLTAPLLCGAGMVKARCGLKYTFTHHRGLFPVGCGQINDCDLVESCLQGAMGGLNLLT